MSFPRLLPLVALAIASCKTLGPDHQTPTVELPASFKNGSVTWKRTSEPKIYENSRWWKVFGDSTLNRLCEQTAASNLDLKAADARLKQARSISRATRSRYFPSLDFNPSFQRSQFQIRGSSGGSQTNNTISLPLDLSYEVDLWGKVRRQVEGTKASEEAAAATVAATRLSLTAETAYTYWALRGVDADRAILDETVNLRQQALKLLEDQFAAGTIGELEVARARTEVSNAESERIALERSRAELTNALAVLTGKAAPGFDVPVNSTLPTPPSIPSGIPADLLLRRPDLLAAERQVAAANAEIGVAEAAYYPSLTFNLSGGLESTSWSNLFDSASRVWSIGPNLQLPLSGQKFLRYQRDAAVANHEAVSSEYKQNVLIAMRETQDALQGLATIERQQKSLQASVTSSQKAFELSRERFSGGLVSFLEVVDAERSRLAAQRQANAARADRLGLTVTLIKSLGGSW